MITFDAAASSFDRHRALPDGVPEQIRAAILGAIALPQPSLLDLGAGTGRIGWPFVAAGDDYVGADLSSGMLRAFSEKYVPSGGPRPRLVQADGARLPFRDAVFDAVLLIQVFGGMSGWRQVLAEARRVLRPAGAIVLGRTVTPHNGADAQMRRRLGDLLGGMDGQAERANVHDDVRLQLESGARRHTRSAAAAWRAERSPRGFLDRHRTGARFSLLPEPVKDRALVELADWAAARFGSLDTLVPEEQVFELDVYRFAEADR